MCRVRFFIMNEFKDKILKFINDRRIFRESEKLILAVSGGADSVALLKVMLELKKAGMINNELSVCHVNHCLRGKDSDGDEQFVKDLCQKQGLRCISYKIDVTLEAEKRNESIETAARQVRMEFYENVCKKTDCGKIVTAHHKGDNAETVVHRMSRGTGFRGLCGIWPVKDFGKFKAARPLLVVNKAEIIDYLKSKSMGWRVDKTNKDISFRRNFIRHELMPALQKNSREDVKNSIFDLSVKTQRLFKKISDMVRCFWVEAVRQIDGKVLIDLAEFEKVNKLIKVEIIRKALRQVGCGERFIKQEHYDSICELAQSKKGGTGIDLPGDFIVHRDYSGLVFEKTDYRTDPEKSSKIDIGREIRLADKVIISRIFNVEDVDIKKFLKEKDEFVEWFDYDKVENEIITRPRMDGDKFMPIGLGDFKKVGKFLTDAKVPKSIRRELMILEEGGNIIWIWPLRLDERYKVTDRTEKILEIEIRKKEL